MSHSFDPATPVESACSRSPSIAARFAAYLLALAALAVVLSPAAALAQAPFPAKPLRVVIPFGAGSSTDIVARIVMQHVSQALGQAIVIDNKPGADGVIAALDVKKAAPDGYTLFFATNSPIASVLHLHKNLAYDPIADFTPIGHIGYYTFFVVVHPSLPAKSLAELVTHAKANAGKTSYATGNTTGIVSTALLARLTDMKLLHIPYKTEPNAITDLLEGRVNMMISSYATVAPHIKDGKLRALLTTLPARSPLLPDVPSITEVGLPPFPVTPWTGLYGPAGMRAEVVARLNRELVTALMRPDVREQLDKQAFAVKPSTPAELAVITKEQIDVWGKAIRDAGIEAQ